MGKIRDEAIAEYLRSKGRDYFLPEECIFELIPDEGTEDLPRPVYEGGSLIGEEEDTEETAPE